MTAIETILARTSYRGAYLPEPVPREDLRLILQAGLAAPSGCNTQTTSLIAVDDSAILQKLKPLINRPFIPSAPAMILVLTQRIEAYRGACFSVQDYSAAIQNMLLAIVDLGYESCWVEGNVTGPDRIGRKMADILGVPADYDPVCLLCVGRAAAPRTHVEKKPFEERAWFNGFKSPE